MTTYEQFKSLLRSHNYKAASDKAEREALENPSQMVFWMNQQAIALNYAGNLKSALEILEKALTIDPLNPWSLLYWSNMLLKSGNAKKALSIYEEVLGDKKLALRAQKGILECLVHLKEWCRILDLISQWNMPPMENYRFRIQALVGLNCTEEAFFLCNEWLEFSPDNKVALWLLVKLEIARDGIEPVHLKYEHLAKIPSKPSVYGEINAYLCKKTGRMDKAVKQYQKLQTITMDPGILRKKAFALAKSGQEMEAIPLLEELLRESPADIFLHASYSAACNRSINLERAWKFYHELLSLNPDDMRLFGRMKHIQNQLGKVSRNRQIHDPEISL